MGCCLTTPNATTTAGDESKTNSKPPPPPGEFEEEETVVKQVLSETPITSKKPPSIQITQVIKQEEKEEELNKNPVVVVEENKAVSEEVSYSSYSATATTTTTTIGIEIDEDGEVNKPMKPKIVTSSTRKVRHPPQPPSSARRTTAQRHRNVGPSNVVRRESLPASRRVLRSPAIREETKQPGQIRRIKGTTTSSVTSSGNRKPIVKVTENKVNVKVRNTTDVMPVQETGESLENPLVSLECFIFL